MKRPTSYDNFLLKVGTEERLIRTDGVLKFERRGVVKSLTFQEQTFAKTAFANELIEFDLRDESSLNLSYKGAEYLYEHYKLQIDKLLTY